MKVVTGGQWGGLLFSYGVLCGFGGVLTACLVWGGLSLGNRISVSFAYQGPGHEEERGSFVSFPLGNVWSDGNLSL